MPSKMTLLDRINSNVKLLLRNRRAALILAKQQAGEKGFSEPARSRLFFPEGEKI